MSYALPPTAKQLSYARSLASQGHVVLPWEVQRDRSTLSRWIDGQRKANANSADALRPTSRQVAYAEKIAARKRSQVPEEYFRSRDLLSRWIDSNRH